MRATTRDDIDFLAPRLRAMDLREIAAFGFASAYAALADGLARSELCFTALSPATGEPIAMFGVVLLPGERFHCVWFLGTDEIAKHGRTFLRLSRRWTTLFAGEFGPVGNCVVAENAAAVRWLEWCGFRMAYCEHAPNGELLLAYVKRPEGA